MEENWDPPADSQMLLSGLPSPGEPLTDFWTSVSITYGHIPNYPENTGAYYNLHLFSYYDSVGSFCCWPHLGSLMQLSVGSGGCAGPLLSMLLNSISWEEERKDHIEKRCEHSNSCSSEGHYYNNLPKLVILKEVLGILQINRCPRYLACPSECIQPRKAF